MATHQRINGDSILLEHVLPSLLRKPHAMIRWAHKDILFSDKNFKKLYNILNIQKVEYPETEFLRIINLIQLTTLSELSIAVGLVLDADILVTFEEVKSLIMGNHKPSNVIAISGRLMQIKFDPHLDHYNNLIPKEYSC